MRWEQGDCRDELASLTDEAMIRLLDQGVAEMYHEASKALRGLAAVPSLQDLKSEKLFDEEKRLTILDRELTIDSYIDMVRSLRSEVGGGDGSEGSGAGSTAGEERDPELVAMLSEVKQIEDRLAEIYAGR